MPEPGRHSRTIRKIKQGLDWAWRIGTCFAVGVVAFAIYKLIDDPATFPATADNLKWLIWVIFYNYALCLFTFVLASIADEKD